MGYTEELSIFASAEYSHWGVAFFLAFNASDLYLRIFLRAVLGSRNYGGIGVLGGAIAQPVLGAILMHKHLQQFPAGQSLATLKSALAGTKEAATWAAAQLTGGEHTLRFVAICTCFTYYGIYLSAFVEKKHV